MRLRYPFLFIALLSFAWVMLAGIADAQRSGKETWRGYVTSDGSRIPYLITFTRNGNTINGSSITNWQAQGALAASIRGTISSSGILTIQEFRTPGESEYFGSTYCYFLGKLRMKEVGGKKFWTGIYSSTREDGSSCGYGEMVLNDPDPPPPLRPVPKPTPKPAPRPNISGSTRTAPIPVQPPKPKPVPPPDTAKPAPPRDTVKPVPPAPLPPDTASYPNLYEWQGDTLSLQLWDGFEEDGDIVSLLWDNTILVDHQRLNNKVKIPLSLLLADGRTHKLTLRLHGQGNLPPNTPNLILADGKEERSLEINGGDGDEAVLYFRKKK